LLLARNLYGTSVDASDGRLGNIIDFLFDDQRWHVGHLVLNAGRWLRRRRVTLPYDTIVMKDWSDRHVFIEGLTRQQIRISPATETRVPISLHESLAEVTIMDWDTYLVNTTFTDHPWQISDDPHIHNTRDVVGYHVQGSDGPIGYVSDFVINDESWSVSDLVVNMRNWLPGRQILIPTAHIEEVRGANRSMRISLSRKSIRETASV